MPLACKLFSFFFFSVPIFFCSSFHFLGMKQIMSSNAVHVQLMNNCERMNVVDDERKTQKIPFARPFSHSLKYCHCLKLSHRTLYNIHAWMWGKKKWVCAIKGVYMWMCACVCQWSGENEYVILSYRRFIQVI